MSAKKIANFLFLRPAMTSRNLTSIGLVIFFMVVYALCGGKITAVPKVAISQGFGGVSTPRQSAPATSLSVDTTKARQPSRSLLGETSTRVVEEGGNSSAQTKPLVEDFNDSHDDSLRDLTKIKEALDNIGRKE
jgi:hypothetical protein